MSRSITAPTSRRGDGLVRPRDVEHGLVQRAEQARTFVPLDAPERVAAEIAERLYAPVG